MAREIKVKGLDLGDKTEADFEPFVPFWAEPEPDMATVESFIDKITDKLDAILIDYKNYMEVKI